jgi:hypothetical protein
MYVKVLKWPAKDQMLIQSTKFNLNAIPVYKGVKRERDRCQ